MQERVATVAVEAAIPETNDSSHRLRIAVAQAGLQDARFAGVFDVTIDICHRVASAGAGPSFRV